MFNSIPSFWFIVALLCSFALFAQTGDAKEFIYNNGEKVYGRTVERTCHDDGCCEAVYGNIEGNFIVKNAYPLVTTVKHGGKGNNHTPIIRSTTVCVVFILEDENPEQKKEL
jgi:hypothetical protein